ncbi:hypothetical protein BD770DRAFT_468825 [Pilaira anomala]|nr:hypothetical protein BD770DRAFT_468825 [Pilaira anomala]
MTTLQPPTLQRTRTPPVSPGILRITIHSCFLNITVKRPYVTITLGDQTYKTSISEYAEGKWNEGFELRVTYHNQLFDTIQLDLYDSYTFFLDKHVGRAEIRIRNLEGMPEVFSSYYEVMEKKLSLGATSRVSRTSSIASGVGAIHAQIAYQYIESGTRQRQASVDLSKMNWLIDQALATEDGDEPFDKELIQQFNQKLKLQRNTRDIQFKKFEEDYPDESSSSSSDDESILHNDGKPLKLSLSRAMSEDAVKPKESTFMDTVSSFFGYQQQTEQNVPPAVTEKKETSDYPLLNTEEDSLKSFPILDTIGSWTMAKETSQVLRAIGKLLVAFGQGFELSNLQILSGFNVVEKFYNDLPRERTWDLVQDVAEIEMASYMWRYAMASYGWKGLNFIGKGNGIFSDAVRAQSDALSICEHLDIPKEDLLAYEFRTGAAFRPSYFIARDRKLNAIVLSIRGTMSTFDTMTDLVCEYEPWKGGLVHKGMKTKIISQSSATWFFRHIAPKLIAYVNKHSTTSLYIVGHSLGASTAAILTIMLQDYINEFRKGKDGKFSIYSIGYAPACGLSLDLANKYKDQIQSIVFADDFVSKLSYGSMMDVKELIIAGAEAAKEMGIGQLFWTGELDNNKKWKKAFERVAECRRRCLESMSNPRLYVAGTVYQFWLDPIPNNESRIVIERATPEKVSTELIIRMSILLDHLPTNFDVAFKRALETLDVGPESDTRFNRSDEEHRPEVKHPERPAMQDKAFESVAELGLKGTTERRGGEGNIIGQEGRT